MEKLLCASCGATLTPDPTQPVLVCEYCDTAMPNAYYDGTAAAPAAPDLAETAVTTLVEMGQSQQLDSDSFGNPLQEAYAVRDAMDIPSREKVYFQLIRSNLLYTVAEGLALTDGGLYYKLDGETGSLSWEGFITGAIACTDMVSKQQPGTLTIGTALSFPIDSDEDSRLARFLIDFHNRVYQQHTGQAAPSNWTVTQQAAVQVESSSLGGTLGKLTLGGVVMSAAKSLLQRSTAQRHIVQRPTLTRTVRTPVRQQRHFQPEPTRPARPAHPQMTQPRHQQRPAQPGGMFRHGAAPGRKGNPGGRGPGGHGGMVGPGPGRRR